MKTLAGIALLFVLVEATDAPAQLGRKETDPRCGSTSITSVYQRGSNGHFEYFLQVKNSSEKFEVLADVEMKNFPTDVTIPNKVIRNIHMDPHYTATEKFGTGSNDKINNNTVYRRTGETAYPYLHVTVKNCRYTQVVANDEY